MSRERELMNWFVSSTMIWEDFGPQSIKSKLSLSISSQSTKVEAINLGPPTSALGSNNSIPKEKAAQFQLFDKPLFTSNVELNILMLAPENVNPR